MAWPTPWKVQRSERLLDCRVFEVHARHSSRDSPGGDGARERTFFAIEAGDWVNVVARTGDGNLVMVRQYRHGVGGDVLEIPGGMVDDGESPADAAARELLEETGYRPRRVVALGRINPNPALFTNVLHTFLAEDCEKVGEIANDPDEETIVELVPEGIIRQRLREGAVDHALVVTAFAWLMLHESGEHR